MRGRTRWIIAHRAGFALRLLQPEHPLHRRRTQGQRRRLRGVPVHQPAHLGEFLGGFGGEFAEARARSEEVGHLLRDLGGSVRVRRAPAK